MKILVIHVGGTHVKILASGKRAARKIPSGPEMTAGEMVARVKEASRDWKYEAVSIGYPGPVAGGKLLLEPRNLGPGWVGFDFEKHFSRPVRVIKDAALEALGSYGGGGMVLLGLGDGLGLGLSVLRGLGEW